MRTFGLPTRLALSYTLDLASVENKERTVKLVIPGAPII